MKVTEPVLYKKKPGRICLSESHLSWIQSESVEPLVSLPYRHIKGQLVNVPGPSGKIILKLECHPVKDSKELSLSFTFVGSNGLEDREQVSWPQSLPSS